MKTKDFFEKVFNKEIIIDLNGHDPFNGWGIDRYIGELKDFRESSLSVYQSLYEKELLETEEAVYDKEKRLKYLHDKSIGEDDVSFTEENIFLDLTISTGKKCYNCSQYVNLQFLENENKLLFVHYDWRNKIVESSKCEYEYKKAIEYSIQIFDFFVFENFFNYSEDYPGDEPDKQYSEEYDLCSHFGQINISKIHASRNVTFGQMGNTSIEIYTNKEKNEIFIVEENYFLDENNEEQESRVSLERLGYEHHGEIGLSVWRWMGANKSDLIKHEYSSEKYNKRYEDPIEIEAKHGVWDVTHYYGTDDHDKLKIGGVTIASILKLKQ